MAVLVGGERELHEAVLGRSLQDLVDRRRQRRVAESARGILVAPPQGGFEVGADEVLAIADLLQGRRERLGGRHHEHPHPAPDVEDGE